MDAVGEKFRELLRSLEVKSSSGFLDFLTTHPPTKYTPQKINMEPGNGGFQ